MEAQGAGGESVAVATYEAWAPAFMASLRGEFLAHRGCLVVGRDHCELVVFRAQDIDWDGETLTYEGGAIGLETTSISEVASWRCSDSQVSASQRDGRVPPPRLSSRHRRL
jgi:hypothetical protein